MNDAITPSFLIAPPNLPDQDFKNAVVVMTAHESEGSMGFIISQPTHLTIHQMLEDLAIKSQIDDRTVLLGGPAGRNQGFVMYEHEKDSPIAPGMSLCPKISISPSLQILQQAAKGEMPGRFELILGYAGWGPGQLQCELDEGEWLHTSFFEEMMFDVPFFERWRHAYEHIGISPYAFVNVPGGAQA